MRCDWRSQNTSRTGLAGLSYVSPVLRDVDLVFQDHRVFAAALTRGARRTFAGALGRRKIPDLRTGIFGRAWWSALGRLLRELR
jgi:hypothetical protein